MLSRKRWFLTTWGAIVVALASMGAASEKPGTSTRFSGTMTGQASAPQEPLSLWYRQPAVEWTEALAVGNGRLGAMVFGGIDSERLQLTQATLWAGGPYDPTRPEALEALPEARRLIFAGKYREADALVGKQMMSKPLGQMPYQTVGDLLLAFPSIEKVSDYRRDLNLDEAVASVTYTVDGVTFKREVFASPVDQVIVVRITATKSGRISFAAELKTPQKASVEAQGSDTLVMAGVNGSSQGIAGALKFQCRVRALASGGMSILIPRASRTSALPHLLETPRLPCLATLTPPAAQMSAAAVEMLKVPEPSPPVPQVSRMGTPSGTAIGVAFSRITRTNPRIFSTVSPFMRRAVMKEAI